MAVGMNIDFVALLKDFGFPVFVTAFVLFRLDKSVKDLTAAVQKLCECVDKSKTT